MFDAETNKRNTKSMGEGIGEFFSFGDKRK
jgi:hypothetical protein